jgi:hypothetical protein
MDLAWSSGLEHLASPTDGVRDRIVMHYEGKTSGTDTGKGMKAYQVTNTRKLYLR